MSNTSTANVDYRSLSDFRYEIRRFVRFSEQAARAAGLGPQQHQALLAVKGLPPREVATVGILSERLQIRHHSAVELVDRLEANQLIRRTQAASDRRKVVINLTARGEKLLLDLTRQHYTELRNASERFLRALTSVLKNERSSRLFRPSSHRTKPAKKNAGMAPRHPK